MANNTTYSYTVTFLYQSKDIPFKSWIPLFTVCLAPLIAHLIAGAPKIVYLHNTAPPWHEVIVHYNPTSIMWRYCAILDRRIRARSWNNIDMAAGNALFWTSNGWDGSEAMMVKSRELCIRPPPPLLKMMLTTDALKTIIVTAQGAQAVFLIAYQKSGFAGFALDSIFMPLAFIGLLRLPSAPWLTEEFLFVDQKDFHALPTTRSSLPIGDGGDIAEVRPSTKLLFEVSSPIAVDNASLPELFHRHFSLRGSIARLFTAAFILGSLALTLFQMIPDFDGPIVIPFTAFLAGWSYAALLFVSIVCIVFCWLRKHSLASSTVLPCISTIWYKVYTGALFTVFLLMIVAAIVETRKTFCGEYTAAPAIYDRYTCPDAPPTNATTPY